VIGDRSKQSFLSKESSMSLRHNLRDQFSTFLTIHDAAGNSYSWKVDSKLQRNIDVVLALERYSDVIEEEIIRHFLNELHHSDRRVVDRSRSHLVSYLQETCYFVSKKLCSKFGREDAVENAFGVAHETICRPGFFERYTPRISQLSTYASNAIRNRLLNVLTGGDGRSIWGKLYHLSAIGIRQIVVSILRNSYRDIEDYVYIHQFYKQVCPPLENNQARQEPNSDQVQAICDLYNSLMPPIKEQLKEKFVAIAPQEALEMMKSCIREILWRQQIVASPESFDAPINSNDDSDTALGDVFDKPDESQNHSGNDELSDLMELQKELANVVDKEILSFSLEQQSIFMLLHGFDCSMDKIGMLYGINQSNISRRYSPLCKIMAAKCVIFCKQQVRDLDVNDIFWLKDLKQWIKVYLNSFYKMKLSRLLESLLNSQFQEVNQPLHKFRDLTEYIDAEGENLIDITVCLVVSHLQQEFQITRSCEPIVPDIQNFTKSWMSDRPSK
jgi:RNA polymerase sigma factor (sigma-70 family)